MSTERNPRPAAGAEASLDDGENPDAAEAWTAELARRAKRVLSCESQGIPWEDVRARILERLGAR
jgi:putative addiction module component (TIGR02574 family)